MERDFIDIIVEYKERYSALDVVEMALGQPAKLDSTGAFWLCPFHTDSTPTNFHVTKSAAKYPNHIKCFAGHCSFSEGGDIFDFLAEHKGLDYMGAMDWIDEGRLRDEGKGKVLKTNLRPLTPVRNIVIAPPYSLEDAAVFHRSLSSLNRDYLAMRGLSNATIDRFKLGYDQYTHRYTIPYHNTIGVYDIKRRRDDWWAEADMLQRGNQWMYEQIDHLWKKRLENAREGIAPVVPTEMDVLKKNYPKYIWYKKDIGVRWLFNEDRLIRGNGHWLPYIFLTADEMSAISLEQEGHPAVCWSGDSAFPGERDKIRYLFHGKEYNTSIRELFTPAVTIYIVADGDASGLAAARKRQEVLGRGEIVMVPVSPGVKDPNDWIAKGFKVKDWIPHLTTGAT